MKRRICLISLVFIILTAAVFTAEADTGLPSGKILTLDEFVRKSCEANPEFRKIIIDRLYLQYEDDINLDIGEIVADFEAGYLYSLDTDREGFDGDVTVSRLFPQTATEISASYNTSPGISDRSSSVTLGITQNIAENRFGKRYKLEKEALEYEKELVLYQIAEAYEDYLYSIVILYFDWLSAARALETAENSYSESKKLLDNVNARKESSIADQEDVNRSELQLLAKMEDLSSAENSYKKSSIRIFDAAGLSSDSDYSPAEAGESRLSLSKTNLENFAVSENSRTYRILNLNEKLGIKNRQIIKNSLLPDISLFTQISASGTGFSLSDDMERSLSFGISVSDIGKSKREKALLGASEIDIEKTKLENTITKKDLDIMLLNYSEDIKTSLELSDIYARKTVLAEKIVNEEQKKFRIGKTDLSSLIDAINTLDLNRRKRLDYETELSILTAGWLNLNDSLISENKENKSGFIPSF